MNTTARSLNLKAALLSTLILLMLVGLWHLATLPTAAGPAATMTPEQ
nr:nitrate ABC transporter, permease protein [Methylibium sp.]